MVVNSPNVVFNEGVPASFSARQAENITEPPQQSQQQGLLLLFWHQEARLGYDYPYCYTTALSLLSYSISYKVSAVQISFI